MTPNDNAFTTIAQAEAVLDSKLGELEQELRDLLILVPELASQLAATLNERDRAEAQRDQLLAACAEAVDALEDPVTGRDPRRILIDAVAALRTDIQRVEVRA